MLEVLTMVAIVAAKIIGLVAVLGLIGVFVAIPVSAVRFTASKTANYDESKNKPGHCW
jgi:predicted PurR-regulated permease PerM